MVKQSFCPYKYSKKGLLDEGFETKQLFQKDFLNFTHIVGEAIVLPKQMAKFLADTKELISTYAACFAISSSPDYNLLINYIDEWGSPFVTSCKKLYGEDPESEKNYTDDDYFNAFCAACYNAELVLSLWGKKTNYSLDVMSSCKVLVNLKLDSFTSNNSRVFLESPGNTWKLPDCGFDGTWLPYAFADTFYRPFIEIGTLLPIEFKLTKKDQELLKAELNNPVFCEKWLKEKLLHALAENISQMEVSVHSRVEKGIITVDFTLHSNLLYFIKYTIDKTRRLCECGCGREIPANSLNTKYYDTVECYQKVHDRANPTRGIKQTITSRYDRARAAGKICITFEQKEELKTLIDNLHQFEKKNADAIKFIVYKKYDEFLDERKREVTINGKEN